MCRVPTYASQTIHPVVCSKFPSICTTKPNLEDQCSKQLFIPRCMEKKAWERLSVCYQLVARWHSMKMAKESRDSNRRVNLLRALCNDRSPFPPTRKRYLSPHPHLSGRDGSIGVKQWERHRINVGKARSRALSARFPRLRLRLLGNSLQNYRNRARESEHAVR